jgi:uncharacterized protein (TIGR00255 family)
VIRSMTGFGEASSQKDGIHYFLEIRSLNNKYFKAVVRLSEELQSLEAAFESKLRERISRGTVTVTASCSDYSHSAAHTINQKALSHYIDQLKALPQAASGELKLDLGALLNLPGVLQPPADEEVRLRDAREVFSGLLDKAIDGLLAMRAKEGILLLDDLRAQYELITERLEQISKRAPDVIAEYEKRLRTRIEMMLKENETAIEPADLIREIAVYAERTDIAEEIKRLGGHIGQFKELLESKDPRAIGRTLDFLAQEMLREANTIASKSPDASISRLTVEIKGAIDRIKEQAANVE